VAGVVDVTDGAISGARMSQFAWQAADGSGKVARDHLVT
jgi:hypothetical protein